MAARRVILIVTCLVVAGLGGVFALMSWDETSKIATVVSALAAVAAIGVAVWTAMPHHGSPPVGAVRVSNTGRAAAHGDGTAVSGVRGPATSVSRQIEVDSTGTAETSGGGDAVSGVRARPEITFEPRTMIRQGLPARSTGVTSTDPTG